MFSFLIPYKLLIQLRLDYAQISDKGWILRCSAYFDPSVKRCGDNLRPRAYLWKYGKQLLSNLEGWNLTKFKQFEGWVMSQVAS